MCFSAFPCRKTGNCCFCFFFLLFSMWLMQCEIIFRQRYKWMIFDVYTFFCISLSKERVLRWYYYFFLFAFYHCPTEFTFAFSWECCSIFLKESFGKLFLIATLHNALNWHWTGHVREEGLCLNFRDFLVKDCFHVDVFLVFWGKDSEQVAVYWSRLPCHSRMLLCQPS